jgi:hypothetical protein
MESWKILKVLYESHNIAKAFYVNNNQQSLKASKVGPIHNFTKKCEKGCHATCEHWKGGPKPHIGAHCVGQVIQLP